MVGPIDVQNVILNATAQNQVNTNALTQASVGEAFKGILGKQEQNEKAEQVLKTENEKENIIDAKKERQKRKENRKDKNKYVHVDIKA